ncbi:MAG: alpha-L-fucosidase, partial [Draconibacterium sp.]|nr:alpha-L-fucosidase [Draconibacterium sp.]
SLYEWFNPTYLNNLEHYVDHHMIPQMKDLITSYEPDILWTDGEWDHPSEKWKSTEFLAWLFNESSVKDNICINDRWGKETRGKHGGYFTTEYGHVYGDVEDINAVQHPWEECRGIGTSFGYNQIEDLGNYLSSEACIDLLIEKVAGGGNLLLDIGPTADGRIPVIQQQRLLDIGAWLDVNGEAIYGTRKWEGAKENKQDNVYFTKKGNDLYIHCIEYPTTPVEIKGVKASKISMLGFDGKVKFNKSGKSVKITAPQLSPATNPSEYAWVFKIENAL